MGPAEMSKRAHWMLRLAAVAVIGVAAWLPRGSAASAVAASLRPVETQAVHASVAPTHVSTVASR